MPQVLLRFLQLSSDENASMSDLAKLVGQDPGLAARILTVANSPALRRGEESKSLLQCLVNLGTRLARTLAACLVVQKVFSPSVDNQQYDLTGFWGHSLRVAEVARTLASEVGYPDLEEAYLSGLLHDVGQLLLLGGVGERYGAMLILSRDEEDLRNIEEQRLGTDHAAVGAWLLDQWNLSSLMTDSVMFHHTSAELISSADSLSRIVWSAHIICYHHKQLDLPGDEQSTELAAVRAMTGLASPRLSSIFSSSSAQVVSIASALGITETADAKTLPNTSAIPVFNLAPRPGDTDSAEARLGEAVRDMAVLQPLQQGLAALDTEAEILLAVRESARILFGLGQVAFLFVDQHKQFLSGAGAADYPEILQRIRIPLNSGKSLAALSAQENRTLSTFDVQTAEMALADVQITRIMGCDGLIFFPLQSRRSNIGVMVCGLKASQSARLQQRIDCVARFANMAASSLEAWRDIRDRESGLEAAITRQYEQHVRKLVHETGNPLGIIKNYLAIMNKKMPDENSMQNEMVILGEEIDRVTQIVQRMSQLSEVLPEAGSVDVNNVIESMLVIYGESLFGGRGITLDKRLDSQLQPVKCERDTLKQILLNLWNNAADAMSKGDILVVSTASGVYRSGRSYLEIRISDTGPGLPDDVIRNLFMPLDPNRRQGHSGVGLSIVAGLVERLEGQITCQTRAGLGTSYSILLPDSRKEDA